MKNGVDVLYEALLLGALCVDGRRRRGIGLLAAHGEGSAANGYGQSGDGELCVLVSGGVAMSVEAAMGWRRVELFGQQPGATYDVRSDLAACDSVHSDHFGGCEVFDGP
jgi:hypothetical protein